MTVKCMHITTHTDVSEFVHAGLINTFFITVLQELAQIRVRLAFCTSSAIWYVYFRSYTWKEY